MSVAPAPAPLVLPEVVANRDCGLAALRWHTHGADATAVQAWLKEPDLAALQAAVPCLWAPAAETDPAIAQTLTDAGLAQPAEAELLTLPKGQMPPTPLPPEVQWLAGTWYLSPPAKPNAAQAASRQRALHLMQLVNADAETRELEEAFRQDAALSYQLLRLVNSSALASRREITSFAQAILILGRQPLKRWLNLLLFAARDDDQRSALLMAHVTLRARGLELLSQRIGHDRVMQDQCFMAGMLSMLDTLFGSPLAELLRPLRISEALRGAVLDRGGDIGHLLATWESAEQRDFETLHHNLAGIGIATDEFNRLALQASAWMVHLAHGTAGRGSQG